MRAVAGAKGTLADTLWEVQFVLEVQSNGENKQGLGVPRPYWGIECNLNWMDLQWNALVYRMKYLDVEIVKHFLLVDNIELSLYYI